MNVTVLHNSHSICIKNYINIEDRNILLSYLFSFLPIFLHSINLKHYCQITFHDKGFELTNPSYILASFIKDKVSIGAWIYPWAFYFVPLLYISVFVAGGFLSTAPPGKFWICSFCFNLCILLLGYKLMTTRMLLINLNYT